MPQFKGTHGTTRLRAQKILAEGFRISDSGRAGKGAYFWEYYDEAIIANSLAVGWYQSQLRRQAYDEKNPECAVIDVSFEVDDDDALDCTREILEKVGVMLIKKLSQPTEDDINNAYESIISRIEKLRGKPILVTRAIVSPPKRMSFPIIQAFPYPGILVVRDESVKIEAKLVASLKE